MRQFFVITAVAIAIAGCGTTIKKEKEPEPLLITPLAKLKAETKPPAVSGDKVILSGVVRCRAGASWGFVWFQPNGGGTVKKTELTPCTSEGEMTVSLPVLLEPGKYSYAVTFDPSGYSSQLFGDNVPFEVATSAPAAPRSVPPAVTPSVQTTVAPRTQRPQLFAAPGLTLESCNADTRTARGFLPWKKFGGDPYQGSPEQAIAEFEWPEELKRMALAEIRGGNPAKSVLKRGDTLNAMAFGRLLPGNKAKVRKNVIVCFPEYKTDVYSVTYQGQEIKIYKPLCGNWSWRAVPAGVESSSSPSDEIPQEATRPVLVHAAPKTVVLEEKKSGFDWSTAKVVGRIDLTPAPQAPAMTMAPPMMQPYPIVPAYYSPSSYSCYPFCTFSGWRGRDRGIDRGVKPPRPPGSTTFPASS